MPMKIHFKKFLLSTAVIAAFFVYSIFQKNNSPAIPAQQAAPIPTTSPNNSILTLANTNTNVTSLPSQTPTSNGAFTPTPNQAPGALPSSTNTPTSPAIPNGKYKNGVYTGVSADAYYGNVQVRATINGGKLVNVQFLDHPQDRQTSIAINDYAMPILTSEALRTQSARVDTVSGATETSLAFISSLSSALQQAK